MKNLTPSTEDCLKTIWSISEWSGEEVVPIELARRMGLSPSTVTEALIFLGDLGVKPEKTASIVSQSAVLGLTPVIVGNETIALPLPAARRIRVTLLPSESSPAGEETD